MILIKRIIELFAESEYPKDIRNKFYLWLMESANRDKKYKYLEDLWASTHAEITPSTLKSLTEVEYKLNFKSKKSNKKPFTYYIKNVAAILLIPILAFTVYKYYIQDVDSNSVITFKECYASNGDLRTTTLPDNTSVVINSGSIIIYPEIQNGTERYVYLNGEAYFDVTHNPDSPFVVKTDGLEIEVLGTKFNVSAYPDDPNITATLEDGVIKLSFNEPSLSSMTLQPNDQVIYNKNTHEIKCSKVSGKHIGAWKDGHLLFVSASIHDIMRSFEHRYGITVYLNSNNYEENLLTVKFVHGETLEESLQILKRIIPDFRYKLESNRLYIY